MTASMVAVETEGPGDTNPRPEQNQVDAAPPSSPYAHRRMGHTCGVTVYGMAECASIAYMPTLSVADARAQLSRLIDATTTTHERFEITRNGHRAAVLMSADDYDILQDTIAVLSDAELLMAHHQGRAAIDAGDYLDADQLTHSMREAGRLPQ